MADPVPPAPAEKTGFVPSTLPRQKAVYEFYNCTPVQVGVALIICANFMTNIVEKQIDPFGDVHEDAFGVFELIYNILFTIELGLNIYGSWFCHFWVSGWNIFDFVVVSIGVINMIKLPLPPALSLLRMMRAFRVFRLFKRVRELNKIIVSIAKAVPGVLNAFLILAIIMSIYAILGVQFYQNVARNCHNPESRDRFFISGRGNCAGEEYFGTFSKSLYSFFQVLTGESWSEAVARPMIWYYIDDPILAVGGGFFFISYIIASMFVLTNVVVAVLLDKMVDPETESAMEDQNGEDDQEEAPKEKIEDPKDQAIEAMATQITKLSKFSCNMRTNLDTTRSEMASLREQIDTILRLVQQDSGKRPLGEGFI